MNHTEVIILRKILNNSVFLQICIVGLVILLGNGYCKERIINDYMYEQISEDFDGAMEEINIFNAEIKNLYTGNDYIFRKDFRFKKVHDMELLELRDESFINSLLKRYRHFRLWTKMVLFRIEVSDIKINKPTKEDIEFLKKLYVYNKRILRAYNESLREHNIRVNKIGEEHKKFIKIYNSFTNKVIKIMDEDDFKMIVDYK